jgi:hypothetical protein
VQKYRTHGGQLLVVCKRDSAARIRRAFAGRAERPVRIDYGAGSLPIPG